MNCPNCKAAFKDCDFLLSIAHLNGGEILFEVYADCPECGERFTSDAWIKGTQLTDFKSRPLEAKVKNSG